MLIPMSNCKVLCDNTKNGFLRLQDTLGVYHVQVLKPVSFQQQITKTPFKLDWPQSAIFAIRSSRLSTYHHGWPSWFQMYQVWGWASNVRAWFWQSYTVILLQIVMVSPETHFVKNHESQLKKIKESKIENTWAFM